MAKNLLIIGIIIFILLLITYLYRKCYINSEGFENLIDNGSFENGQLSKLNTGSNLGNNTIKMINPGKSSYVLRQNTVNNKSSKKTRYQINLNINLNTNYKISTWVGYSNDWDGNYNIFNLSFYTKCNSNDIIVNSYRTLYIKGTEVTQTWQRQRRLR